MTLAEMREARPAPPSLLDLGATLGGKRLLILGGTGFLGKVWWTLMLHRFPEIEQLYLVVRARPDLSSEERFWSEVATNPGLDPLRELYGSGYEEFLRDKITVLEGDIIQPFCGISSTVRDELRGTVHAVANASGVVDFQPPLDVALEVNAFGCRNLVELAEDLGRVPILHTSTCFVAGYRTGTVEERNPLDLPFPFVGQLERAHWDPDREIAECLDIIEQAKHRANDAFRQSAFVDQAKTNLRERGEPARGQVLDAEVENVRRRFVEGQLSAFGLERAQFWGWPNTYTYTKSIGEQIVAKSGLEFCIVRPAIVESCVDFPHRGWNEGITTSAPLIYAIREGQPQFPGGDVRLDVIPCDMVATGMVLSLAELLRGEAKPVYQYGTGDTNPISMARIYELSGLYKRKHFLETGRGSRLENFMQRHMEGAFVSAKNFDQFGPKALARTANWVAKTLEATPHGPLSSVASPGATTLRKFARKQERVAHIIGQFIPFTAELDYEFRCGNTRDAFARLGAAEQARLYWAPESLDWRSWFLEVHAPGLERWVFPQIEQKLRKSVRALKAHQTLTELLEEMAERYGLAVALQYTEAAGLSRVSYAELRDRALRCAERLLVAGIRPGDHIILCAPNHPDWVAAFFGILYCEATVVPVPPSAPVAVIESQLRASKAARVVAADPLCDELRQAGVEALRLAEVVREGEGEAPARPPLRNTESVAVALFDKVETPVRLSHRQITALLAALAPLLPLGPGDRVLSLMPLAETFELMCGCLLPLSRGSRVVYLDDTASGRIEATLEAGRITAVAAVPEVWGEISRTLVDPTLPAEGLAARVVEQLLEANRRLQGATGMDLGRLLFGQAHRRLGGHLRLLISGGAPMDPQIAARFAGVGLPLMQGYEDESSGAVLAMTRDNGSTVGAPLPEVEIRIDDPDATGVGAVLARGPSLLGREPGPSAWLSTGDLGRLDARGRLTMLGAREDAIASPDEPTLYPLEVESLLRRPSGVREWAAVGLDDGASGTCATLIVVPELGVSVDHKLDGSVARALAQLPGAFRPAVVLYTEEPLPRGASGRLDRGALRRLAITLVGDSSLRAQTASRAALRKVAAPAARLGRTSHLANDLGLDSTALESVAGELDAALGIEGLLADLQGCGYVVDIDRHLDRALRYPQLRPRREEKHVDRAPRALRLLTTLAMAAGERPLFNSAVPTNVLGLEWVPSAGPVLVVTNPASGWEFNVARFTLASRGPGVRVMCWTSELPSSKALRSALLSADWMCAVPDARGASAFVETALALLAEGQVVVVRGARSRVAGEGCVFDSLVGRVAKEAAVPVVPLALKVWRRARLPGLPRSLTACFGRPLELNSAATGREAASLLGSSLSELLASLERP